MTRVAAYYRVSTVRQAERDLSIPDQRRRRRGFILVKEYTESGASARDDSRPVFRHMIDDALQSERPFDLIMVHSFSRFYRDEVSQEIYLRRLAANGVTLQSSTEEVGDGFGGETTRRILGIIAEMENRQRAARVKQTMKENARQGFWNGSRPPFGYRTVISEKRGETQKKRLEVDPREAEIVRLIYRLCLRGAGKGPLGIKTIVAHLNAKGLNYRGRMFRTNEVHRILTSSTYAGQHFYGKRKSRTQKLNDRADWTEVKVPSIIDPETHEAVQQHLGQRRPSVTPARLINGAMLLTQVARCPHCGGGMTLRTGKSGRYRYYTCSAAATKGKTACPGRSIRMDALDGLVLSAIERKILDPKRLAQLLRSVIERTRQRNGADHERERSLAKELRQAESRIERLLAALADGLVTDTDLFRTQMAGHHQRRDELTRLIGYSRRRRELPPDFLSARRVEAFSRSLQSRLRDNDSGLRRAYVRLLVDRVTVGERRIEIRGPKAALVAAAGNADLIAKGEVPRSVQDWRREWDSNRWCR